MTVDERVGAALSDLAATIIARPDPAGRAYARFRRSRRRRRTTLGVLAVLVIALIVPVAVNAHPQEISAVAQWSAWMTQSPRGPLGADQAFVADLERYVMQREQNEGYRIGLDREYDAAKVVFAADIARMRVALVALQIHGPSPQEFPDDALWLTAPTGATAGTLAGEAGVSVFSQGLGPLETGHLADGLTVAVAPAGCGFETAALPAIDTWTPERTDAYLVRTPLTSRPEWWRVVCDGVVRVERPSMAPRTYDRDAAAVVAVSGKARGDQSQLTGQRYGLAATMFGSEVFDPPSVVWSGPVPGVGVGVGGESPGDGYAMALASRLVGHGWKLCLRIEFPQPNGGNYMVDSEYGLPGDPLDARSFLVMRSGDERPSALAIAPAGAVRIRAVVQGATVDDVAVTKSSAVLRLPASADATYEALNAAGAIVARAVLLTAGVRTGRPWVENWGFPVPTPTS